MQNILVWLSVCEQHIIFYSELITRETNLYPNARFSQAGLNSM